jgi:KaiC/GvpD/RAD55 family RecA-like ATPase
LAKISIGVRGIDNLLSGGVIAGNTVLVEGIPGAGKTTLGMEFIYRGIRDFGDPGIILTLEYVFILTKPLSELGLKRVSPSVKSRKS